MAEILIENVSKSYISKDGSVQALKNVNLAIESGDIFGIIGMSGAGKKYPGPLYELPGGAHRGYGFHPGKSVK